MKKLPISVLKSKVLDNLTPDLLKKGFGGKHPLSGHCYVATEALYHLMEDKSYFPVRAKDINGVTHWWLENDKGQIIDLTREQYTDMPPYEAGKRGGFLTKNPSKRAQELIRRVNGS